MVKDRNSGKAPGAQDGKLGFWALAAVVFGMMVGAGLYNLPASFAIGAGPLAVCTGWGITAAGMLLLAATFKILNDRFPDLNAGIYQYAQKVFGNYAGFNIAWGYWLFSAFSNVAFAVIINDSLGVFFPEFLNHGWQSLLFGTALIWIMFFVIIHGIQTARILNTLMAALKIAAIIFIVILLALNIKAGIFTDNLLGEGLHFDGFGNQLKSTMMVTLWCFVGIEGAAMLASRAKKPEIVGKATISGFALAWALYVLISLLAFGVMSRAQLAGLHDPSVAGALRYVCGEWASYFVIFAILVSLMGGWLAWTLVCAQVPQEAARVGMFPKYFLKMNRHGMPAYGLVISSALMEAFLIMVLMAPDVYMTTITISSMMVLPAYLISGIFLWKATSSLMGAEISEGTKRNYRLISAGCVVYCIWLIYSGGWQIFAFTSIFYITGTGFYLKASSQIGIQGKDRFKMADRLTALVLLAGLLISGFLLLSGHNPF